MEETIPEPTITTMPYLKWGAQKRLRCMKVQFQENNNKSSPLFLEPPSQKPIDNEPEKVPEPAGELNPVAGFRPNSPEIWQRPRRLRGSAKDNELHGDGGWPKIDLQLSRKEKEDDFLAMGGRLALRPKKRPKYIQKKIDRLLPGGWLPDVNPNTYEVHEDL
ncbi:hypothetical protein AMTRI_Chr13g118220 [Amborella trichopoda]|uniref:Uncharacterized protein n=1 Tax=Amborella trichopoda TaxID=13333 RepID=W1P8S5_AMBTC|nr:uncharacterized protein LOC18432158 [Amborella trichopoda]ERN04006.1 hypothetical protein AMTR_s00079p00160810 [Amborella trichopoda]|eukprot:XP_006842331.1 uncharacterized protein LOC18432158 [Amborella trichopoda]